MKRFFKRCDEHPIELTSAEITLNPDKVIDLLANLARRVTELERKLTEVDNKVEMALDDIITLDERTQPLLAIIKAVKNDG